MFKRCTTLVMNKKRAPLHIFPQFWRRGKNSAGISKHEQQTVASQFGLISHTDSPSSAGINCCQGCHVGPGDTYRLLHSAPRRPGQGDRLPAEAALNLGRPAARQTHVDRANTTISGGDQPRPGPGCIGQRGYTGRRSYIHTL